MSDPAFEAFVNLELPKRGATLLSSEVGFTGDPNTSVDPALNNAPEGRTYYWNETAKDLWHKIGPLSTDWDLVSSGGSGGGTLKVANQAARLALSPSEGDLVYQEDIKVTYQYLSDDGGAATWRVRHLPAIDDEYQGGFPSIYYYVDTAGSDTNDGRQPGASRAKATLGGVFRELNDAGYIGGGSGFDPFVEIIMAPGAYSETVFGNLDLDATVPGGVFIIPSFGSYANNETLTQSADNGLVGSSAVERDLTTSAFTTFAGRGDRFIWVNDGFSTNGDVFPAMAPAVLPSTTPNLRIASSGASTLTTFNLSQYETTLDAQHGIQARDPQTRIWIQGLAIDNTTTNIVSYRNLYLLGCKIESSGGSSVVFVENDFIDTVIWRGMYLDLPSQVNFYGSSMGDIVFGMQNSDIDEGRFDIYSGFYTLFSTIQDVGVRYGSFNPSQNQMCAGSLSAVDFNGTTGTQLSVSGFANVRQTGAITSVNATGTLIATSENGRFTRQTGDWTAAAAGLTGPAITTDSMGQALGVSGYTAITTTPVGQDIQVGNAAVQTFAAVAGAGGVSDLDTLSRAT